MARIKQLSNVGIFVSDQKRARDFYTKKLGLKVVGGMPAWGYLELATRRRAPDAALNLWTPKAWGLSPADARKKVGVVTGVGFRAANFDATLLDVLRKGAKVETWAEEDYGRMASVEDPDGNSVFVVGPSKGRSKKPGLEALEFITIASRDSKRTGAFFQKALGMRRSGEGFATYRLGRDGTALMPFTPRRAMYQDPGDYKRDMAAIGEETAIMFEADDVYAVEKRMLARGVKFKSPAKPQDWGGTAAEFFDPDRNVYTLFEPRSR